MGWDTVAPIIQVRTDWEASPASASLFLLCLHRAEWLSTGLSGSVQCEEGCWRGFPYPGEHRTWSLYPHPQAENLSPFGGRKQGICTVRKHSEEAGRLLLGTV